MTDPAGPIRALKERFVAAAERVGLTVTVWGYDPEPGVDSVNVILTADDDTLAAPIDQPVVNAAFDTMLAGDRAAADDQAAADVEADLTRRLGEGGSILPD